MIKEIVNDCFLLSYKAQSVTKEDIAIAVNLLDTLKANKDRCVGMAANMIGEPKKIIAFFDGCDYVVMLNPEIIKVSGKRYEAKEGCLCHSGVKKAMRYECVKVSYLSVEWKKKIKTYTGFTAQIIQHEMDHLEGILI